MHQRPLSRLANIQGIYLNQCRFFLRRYPELADLALPLTAESAKDVFAILCLHVRRIDAAAGALDLIEEYEKCISKTTDNALRGALLAKVVKLQSARGLAHKALPLVDPADSAAAFIDQLQSEHASYYGCDLRQFDMSKARRGASIRLYYAAHTDALKSKRVLHFAPEAELRPWMVDASAKLGFTYETADGFVENVDHSVDLCDLPFEDEQFDVIINHRVLEHVIDDATALTELHRVLRPGGVLNISVPESLYLPRTADWRVPDPRVHMHIRIYGRDFPMLLMRAGFRAERCDWLFQQPPARLHAANAYPMLFYNAVKD